MAKKKERLSVKTGEARERGIERLKVVRKELEQKYCFAVRYLGNQAILWECTKGHRFVRKEDPPVSEMLLTVFCRKGGYWYRGENGRQLFCAKCYQQQQFQLVGR